MWQALSSNIFFIRKAIFHKVKNTIFLLFIAHMVYNLNNCKEDEIEKIELWPHLNCLSPHVANGDKVGHRCSSSSHLKQTR
jgi:hypothetical protein